MSIAQFTREGRSTDQLVGALDLAVASGKFEEVVRACVELAGFDTNSVIWSHTLNVQGHMVDPHPLSGQLVIDGEAQYSASWL